MSGGTMPLTCAVGMPEAGTHYADTHGAGYPERPVACGKSAVVTILFEQEVWHAGDVQENILTAYPVCADHAAEEVHEMSSMCSPDEYVLVNLPEVSS